MLVGLVLAGFATVTPERLEGDGPTIRVERFRTTDVGRRALRG